MTYIAHDEAFQELYTRDWTILQDEAQIVAPTTELYLDKAWEGLAWLLSAKKRASYALPDGAPIPTDVQWAAIEGVGMERIEALEEAFINHALLKANHVKDAAKAFSGVTPAQLRKEYDPRQMAASRVYPLNWIREGEEGFLYLAHHFESLQRFYMIAAAKGQQVLLLAM